MTALRDYRKRCNLTQGQLAELLGITGSAITNWEAGTRKPDIIQLKKLAKILNCSADDLLKPINI